MVTGVEALTALVVMPKVALVALAGMVTLDGTWAAALSLERATIAPPDGAGPLRVTVPVEPWPPPTVDGLTPIESRVGEGGVTERIVLWVTDPYEAEMVTGVEALTALVVIPKVALVALAGMVTLDGT